MGCHNDRYHSWRTSHGDQEDCQEPYNTKQLTEMLTKHRAEESKSISELHTELDAEPHYLMPTKWVARSKRIFYRSCLQRGPQRPTKTLLNTASRDAEICIYNVQYCIPTTQVCFYCGQYDHLRWSLHVRYGSVIYHASVADAMRTFYYARMVTSESHWNQRLWWCQERKLTSLPKVMTSSRCNDIDIERSGMPHMTLSQQAEQVKTGHHCNQVEFEHIGMSYMTVSQQAEQSRVVTGRRATQEDDRSYMNIVSTRSRIKSPMNANINSGIQDIPLPSHDGSRQSIWWWSRQ